MSCEHNYIVDEECQDCGEKLWKPIHREGPLKVKPLDFQKIYEESQESIADLLQPQPSEASDE